MKGDDGLDEGGTMPEKNSTDRPYPCSVHCGSAAAASMEGGGEHVPGCMNHPRNLIRYGRLSEATTPEEREVELEKYKTQMEQRFGKIREELGVGGVESDTTPSLEDAQAEAKAMRDKLDELTRVRPDTTYQRFEERGTLSLFPKPEPFISTGGYVYMKDAIVSPDGVSRVDFGENPLVQTTKPSYHNPFGRTLEIKVQDGDATIPWRNAEEKKRVFEAMYRQQEGGLSLLDDELRERVQEYIRKVSVQYNLALLKGITEGRANMDSATSNDSEGDKAMDTERETSSQKDLAFPTRYGNLPPGEYVVKGDGITSETTPIRVDDMGGVTTPPRFTMLGTTADGGTVSYGPPEPEVIDPYSQHRAIEDYERKQAADELSRLGQEIQGEDRSVKPGDLIGTEEKKVPFEQDPKKMMILGFSIMAVIIAAVVLIVLIAVNSGRDEDGPGGEPTSVASDVSTTEGVESSTEPEASATEAPVSITELENSWFLGGLETAGVETYDYTDAELIDMGRNACAALDGYNGDFDALFLDLMMLTDGSEETAEFVGSIVGAAVHSYCIQWVPALDEYTGAAA